MSPDGSRSTWLSGVIDDPELVWAHVPGAHDPKQGLGEVVEGVADEIGSVRCVPGGGPALLGHLHHLQDVLFGHLLDVLRRPNRHGHDAEVVALGKAGQVHLIDDRPQLDVVLEQEAAELEELVDICDPPPVERTDENPVEPATANRVEEPLEAFALGTFVPGFFILESRIVGDVNPVVFTEPGNVFPLVFEFLPRSGDPKIPGTAINGLRAERIRYQ